MSLLIRNAFVVNEGSIEKKDVLIKDKRITFAPEKTANLSKIIDAEGKYLLPGIIDDQVHFREPGFTEKGEIYTESKAAAAGGITSYMEMPNTEPNTLTQKLLEEKYKIAAEKSLTNYSFYMGVSNNNFQEVMKTPPEEVCGIKVFLGSSTGNMLVNDPNTLKKIFSQDKLLIAAHCEDEETVKKNALYYRNQFGEDLPLEYHSKIRDEEACFKSSQYAVSEAKKYGSRLHVIHLSTAKELSLFDSSIPLKEKKITSEVCVHHLWFCDSDYKKKGAFIKWNPSIKTAYDRDALLEGLLNNKIDVVATDHAPHLEAEKKNTYFQTPSGGPLVQHALPVMLEHYHNHKISLEKIVEKMSHAPADAFKIKERGYVREGYFADLVLVDINSDWEVKKGNIFYKCGWSPFEGDTLRSRVVSTFVNGDLVYHEGEFYETSRGARLLFER